MAGANSAPSTASGWAFSDIITTVVAFADPPITSKSLAAHPL
jgi:hypothetical protein